MAQVVDLLDALHRSDSLDMNEVTDMLNNIMSDLQNIYQFTSISANMEVSALTRKASSIMIRKMLIDHTETVSLDTWKQIGDFSLQIIKTEGDIEAFRAICDVLNVVVGPVIENTEWDELVPIGLSLFEAHESRIPGFYYFEQIFQALPDDQARSLVPQLTSLCEAALSQDTETLTYASELLSSIIFTLEEDEDLNMIPTLRNTVVSALKEAVEVKQEEKRVCSLVSLAESLFYDRFCESFPKTTEELLLYASNVAVNEKIHINIRLLLQNILDNASVVDPDVLIQLIPALISSSLSLAFELCRLDRYMPDYRFPDEFLSTASSIVPPEEFLSFLMETTMNFINSGDPAGIQVALFALSSIIANCQEAICTDPDDIVHLTHSSLSTDDELIAEEAAEVIEELAISCVSILLPNFDEFVSLLMQNLSNPKYLRALDTLLLRSQKVTVHLNELIPILMALLNEDTMTNKEQVIACLSSAIKYLSLTDDSLYSMLTPYLIEIMGSQPDLAGPIYEFFGTLALSAPFSMKPDLNSIVESMLAAVTVEDMVMSKHAISALNSIITMFSTTLSAYIPYLLDRILVIIESSNSIENSSTVFQAVQCLRICLQIIPSSSMESSLIDKTMNILRGLLQSISALEQLTASVCISEISEVLGAERCGIFFNDILSVLSIQESEDAATEMFKTLADLIPLFETEFLSQHQKAINTLLKSTFKETSPVFKNSMSKKFTETLVLPAAVRFIIALMVQTSHTFVSDYQSVIEILRSSLRSTNRFLKAISIHILSCACHFTGFTQFNSSNALNSIFDSNLIVKLYGLRGTTMIFSELEHEISQRDNFEAELKKLTNSEDTSVSDAAIALYSLFLQSHHQQSSSLEVLSSISKIPEEESDVILSLYNASSVLDQDPSLFFIHLRTLLSPKYLKNAFKPGAFDQSANFMKSIPNFDEKLSAALKYNELQIMKVQEKIYRL